MMQTIELTKEEQMAMYMKCTKKELIEMLLEANKVNGLLLTKLPRELGELQRVIANSPTATLTEVKEEITFDKFWARYDEKVRSSKKKALRIWDRLGQAGQAKAFKHISKYEQSIAPGVAKKYAETYLNAELWNN